MIARGIFPDYVEVACLDMRNPQMRQGFSSLRGFQRPVCFKNSANGKTKRMSAFHREKVLSVRHWTDTLFSFRATRNSGFRFQSGQFAMIGLEVDGRPLLRAYSMASAN